MKRLTSFMLIFIMVFGIIPWYDITAYAFDKDNFYVDEIIITKLHEDGEVEVSRTRLTIRGAHLQNAEVGTITSGSGYVGFENPEYNNDSILQFIVEGNTLGSSIIIEGVEISISQDGIPAVSKLDKRHVKKDKEGLKITGSELDKIGKGMGTVGDPKYSAHYEKDSSVHEFEFDADDPNIQDPEGVFLVTDILRGNPGNQDIVLKKEELKNIDFKNSITKDVKIVIRNTYENIFKIVDEIDIDNLTMNPNRGEAGSEDGEGDEIIFTANSGLQNFDVFFLKDLSDEFTNENKGVNTSPKADVEGKEVLKTHVPRYVKGLIENGEYYVVLTNHIPDGEDPEDAVTMSYVVGDYTDPLNVKYEKFTIIEAKQKMYVNDISPDLGPDTGSEVEISGVFFGTLNIPDLKLNSDSVEIKPTVSPEEKMSIDYGGSSGGTYKSDTVTSVNREITVIIGGKVTFVTDVAKHSFTDALDKISVITPHVTDAHSDPIQDVVIETTTTISLDGKDPVVIKDRAELTKAYRYIPSTIKPTVKYITPDKIQVEKQSSTKYTLDEDMIVSIEGDDFLIHKYTDEDGKEIVRYPIIELGNDIRLNKNNNGLDSNEDLYLKIFDTYGREIDGSQGNEVGTRIIVKIPKEYQYKDVDQNGTIIGQGTKETSITNIGKTFVKVINPVKNQNTEGLSSSKEDAVEFILADDKPIITKVKPNIVTVDGGEGVIIEGNNFDRDVKVFIDGKEVPGIIREGDGKKITLNAPAGREGNTQIQVMNPSGAIAIAEFIYVTTYTDPEIHSFTPNKGSNKTLVVLKGDNFLKPQPSTTDISGANIYKVIGTRILLGDTDINSYNRDDDNKIILKKYESLPENKIIYFGDNRPKLRDYYQSLILSEKETINTTGNSFYTFDINTRGDVILSNGKNDNYTVTDKNDDGTFKAISESGDNFKITVNNDSLDMDEILPSGSTDTPISKTLYFKTPYIVEDNVITGNRVKIVGKNEIYFTVPMMDVEKWYDLTVQNPDTQSDRRIGMQGFYYFKTPKKNPTINKIEPNRGSTEGGYTAHIYGADFESNGDIKSRVFVGGVEVQPEDVIISTDKTKITIIIPQYPGNLKDEIQGDRKTVPVVVTNSDGGNYSLEDGFTYVIPTSNPKITKILPNESSAAGGENIQIWGTDFRYFEPYEDANGNAAYDDGEKYQDLNNNGKWDNLENKDEYRTLKEEYETLINTPGVTEDEKAAKDYRNILPKIYFGKQVAEILDFSDGYISVVVPVGEKGNVDVYVLNNDFGTSNTVDFTYRASTPRITKIVPNIGKKQGRDNIEIHGSDFNSSKIKVLKQTDASTAEEVDMPVIRFGGLYDTNISNITIEAGQLNAGTIIGTTGKTQVGNLEVEYDSYDSNNKKIYLTATVGDKEYKANITNYNDEEIYLSLEDLIVYDNGSGNEKYDGYELVKVKVDTYARRIIVERGYSPKTNLLNSGQVEVKTPSYYTIGIAPVTIINPDKGEATGQFEYKNPDSNPEIIEITRDGQPSQPKDVNGKKIKVVKVNYKGGSIISVMGSDFRENAKISVGNIMEIPYSEITPILPNKLTFKIGEVPESEVGKFHKVVVQNEDGAFAASDDVDPPIYIQFIKGETSPKIDSINPDRGISDGGTRVTIKGYDFRERIEGYGDKKIAVYFGEIRVPDEDVDFIDYKTIIVKKTPPSDPKTVDVKVENPDGEISNSVQYTYLSNPKITQVVDAEVNTKNITSISVDGGEEIQLRGSDFMSGARVIFSPVIRKKTDSDDTDIITIVDEDGHSEEYVLVSGDETGGQFIDAQNMKVTTPPGKLGSKGVMIINPDNAASNIYDIVYLLDQIDAPKGVNAELIYDKYIRVTWSAVEGATSYEIYAIEDDKEMYLVGTTDLTTFVYRDVKSKTDYRFVVKAIGEFGLSKGSEKSNEVTTKSGSGYEDKDGEINEKTVINRSGDTVNVSIGTDDYDEKETVIDLTKGEYAGAKEVVISIPARVATSYLAKDVKVILSDMYVKFNPTAFNISKLYESKDKDNAGVKFQIGINQKNDVNSLSNDYELKADAFVGADKTSIDYLKSNMEVSLDFDSAKANLRRMRNISLRRYDEYKNEWTYVKQSMDSYSTSINSPVNRLGRYSIIGSRR